MFLAQPCSSCPDAMPSVSNGHGQVQRPHDLFPEGLRHPVPSLLSPVLTEPPFQDCGNFYGCPY
ncbi:hypothetical protein, partial [Commensalibacter sp. M0357]|uniref:hypothetical protein n=1 Tax=Commensalibacter sp. M0357 TaxID=2750979 RepID=UPI001E331E59